MSTVSTEHDAPLSASAGKAASTQRLGRLLFGSLALLTALALLGSAIAAVVGLETNRDSTGYFITHTHHYQTSTHGLSTESLNVGGVTGALEARLVRLRITATSNNPTKPLFIGIARTQDVERYLTGVKHDELRDIKFDPFQIEYRRLGTGAPKAPPSAKTFWQTRASGTGTPSISWPVKRGQWSAVVMNADGSRDVSVDAQVAARLAGAWWFVASFIALGALSLAGGIALVRSGLRKRPSETSSETEAV